MRVLLPLLYLPPISYMALILAADEACIEAQENYIKSSLRNRATIIGSQGLIDMSVPLSGGRDRRQLYADTQIAYTWQWQHRHRISIMSCYGSSPFFEHYMPYLEPFYDKEYRNLFDFNKALLVLLMRLMKVSVPSRFTTQYEKETTGMTDLRRAYRATQDISSIAGEEWGLREVPYIRVFDTAVPAGTEISCIDLLFNEGPRSADILRAMIVRP